MTVICHGPQVGARVVDHRGPIPHNGRMAGKRAGSRRGPRATRGFSPVLLGLALGVTLLVVAWGYLVLAAIDFGASARGGRSEAWWFLAMASVGAVACLFAGLMLVARILRLLGITRDPAAPPTASDPSLGLRDLDGTGELPAVRPQGGKRAAR